MDATMNQDLLQVGRSAGFDHLSVNYHDLIRTIGDHAASPDIPVKIGAGDQLSVAGFIGDLGHSGFRGAAAQTATNQGNCCGESQY